MQRDPIVVRWNCTILNEYSHIGWWWWLFLVFVLFCWDFLLLSSTWPRITDHLPKLENRSYLLLWKNLINLCSVQPKLPLSIISSSLTFFILERVFYKKPRLTLVSILKRKWLLPNWYCTANGAVTGLYKQWTQYLSPNTIRPTVVYFKW